MSSSATVWEGACACGSVKYTIDDDQITDTNVCHCKICQAWTGGVYLYVESKKVVFTGDVKAWKSSEFCERLFCANCGSGMFCRLLMEGPMNGMYHVSAGTLKDWKNLKLTNEIFIDRKPKAYEMQAANGEKTCQMTMNECYKLWGVPVEDENGEDAERDKSMTDDKAAGSKRKLEPEGSTTTDST